MGVYDQTAASCTCLVVAAVFFFSLPSLFLVRLSSPSCVSESSSDRCRMCASASPRLSRLRERPSRPVDPPSEQPAPPHLIHRRNTRWSGTPCMHEGIDRRGGRTSEWVTIVTRRRVSPVHIGVGRDFAAPDALRHPPRTRSHRRANAVFCDTCDDDGYDALAQRSHHRYRRRRSSQTAWWTDRSIPPQLGLEPAARLACAVH